MIPPEEVDRPLDAWIGDEIGKFLFEHRQIAEQHSDKSVEDLFADSALKLKTWLHPNQKWMLGWLAMMSMERQDHCNFLDNLYDMLAPLKPTPNQWDLMADAEEWARSMPQEVLRVFVYAIWSSMNEARQNDFLKQAIDGMSEEQLGRVARYASRKEEAAKATTPADGQRGLPERPGKV